MVSYSRRWECAEKFITGRNRKMTAQLGQFGETKIWKLWIQLTFGLTWRKRFEECQTASSMPKRQELKDQSQILAFICATTVPNCPCILLHMGFGLGLPPIRKKSFVMAVAHRFLKDGLFHTCWKPTDSTIVACLFFGELYRLHGVPNSFVSDADTLNFFWITLWKKIGKGDGLYQILESTT